jgi:hypothetical protein
MHKDFAEDESDGESGIFPAYRMLIEGVMQRAILADTVCDNSPGLLRHFVPRNDGRTLVIAMRAERNEAI